MSSNNSCGRRWMLRESHLHHRIVPQPPKPSPTTPERQKIAVANIIGCIHSWASVMVWTDMCATGKIPLVFIEKTSRSKPSATNNEIYETYCSRGQRNTSAKKDPFFSTTKRQHIQSILQPYL